MTWCPLLPILIPPRFCLSGKPLENIRNFSLQMFRNKIEKNFVDKRVVKTFPNRGLQFVNCCYWIAKDVVVMQPWNNLMPTCWHGPLISCIHWNLFFLDWLLFVCSFSSILFCFSSFSLYSSSSFFSPPAPVFFWSGSDVFFPPPPPVFFWSASAVFLSNPLLLSRLVCQRISLASFTPSLKSCSLIGSSFPFCHIFKYFQIFSHKSLTAQ